jgi:hypothetical protein
MGSVFLIDVEGVCAGGTQQDVDGKQLLSLTSLGMKSPEL